MYPRFQVSTKTTKQCVEFYYVWKKVCTDEYKRIKLIGNGAKQRDTPPISQPEFPPSERQNDALTSAQPTAEVIPRTFTCEYAACSAVSTETHFKFPFHNLIMFVEI